MYKFFVALTLDSSIQACRALCYYVIGWIMAMESTKCFSTNKLHAVCEFFIRPIDLFGVRAFIWRDFIW